MTRPFFVAWLACFVVWMFGSFVAHGVLLHADYANLPTLFRPESEAGQYFPFMIFAHVVMAGAFVWLYGQGVERKPWLAQGLRFAAAIALLAVVPMYTIYYVVQPLPASLVVRQIVFDSLVVLVLGALVAFLYRSRTHA